MPEDDIPSADGLLARLAKSRPSSPDGKRAAGEWQETSRRLLHPRSVWSPPSPPRRQLPKIRDDAHSRRNRSSNSSANSRESSNESPSKSISQPESRSESQDQIKPASQPMISTQGSAESVPPLLANNSTSTFRTNSTRESVLASPMLPPRPNIGRSLSIQLPPLSASSASANALELNALNEISNHTKRRWSGDDGPTKRERSE
jgi:hypothetical protein